MNQTVDEINRAKSEMAGAINKAITDAEALRKAAAEVSGDGSAAAPAKFEEKLASVQARLAAASRPAIATARETAAAADDYVHESPWTAIGIAAAAGILIGFLTAQFHSHGSSCDSEELS